MTRGGDGLALSPAVVVACHPPLQPLGEEQSIAPAADSLVDARQPGGSEQQQQQQQLQQEQQQEQKLQELRLQQQQTDAALSGWGDECALLKQEQQDNANTEAQEGQRLSVTGRQTSPYPAEKPPPRSSLKHPLPAGVDEATGKAYVEWPTSLLQRVCTHRGSREMSACRVNETMAKVLTQQDLSADRETPYMDDLQEIALLVPGQFGCLLSSCQLVLLCIEYQAPGTSLTTVSVHVLMRCGGDCCTASASRMSFSYRTHLTRYQGIYYNRAVGTGTFSTVVMY